VVCATASHERARVRRPTPTTPIREKQSCARPLRDDSYHPRPAYERRNHGRRRLPLRIARSPEQKCWRALPQRRSSGHGGSSRSVTALVREQKRVAPATRPPRPERLHMHDRIPRVGLSPLLLLNSSTDSVPTPCRCMPPKASAPACDTGRRIGGRASTASATAPLCSGRTMRESRHLMACVLMLNLSAGCARSATSLSKRGCRRRA
jgi:hypothetical protein